MVYRWLSRGWLALGVFFVLLAVLVSVVRLGGPLLNQHRAAVIGTLLGRESARGERGSRRAGVDSPRPGHRAGRTGHRPDSGRFSLRFGKVWAHLDFWRSLNELRPVFGQLILSDGNIALDMTQPATPSAGRARTSRRPCCASC